MVERFFAVQLHCSSLHGFRFLPSESPFTLGRVTNLEEIMNRSVLWFAVSWQFQKKVCVRWSWQGNLTELNLMFYNKSGTKRFRFSSEHSLTFADAIQGVDGHKLLIPAISCGDTAP